MVDRRLIIDACCLINLDVSGQLLDIASCFSPPLAVSDVVYEEEFLTSDQRGDTDKAIKSTIIEKISLEDTELAMLVRYASEMGDDGESATFAIAINRKWSVATDDKAAINFLKRLGVNVSVFSTLEIVKFWAETKNKSKEEIRQVLAQIRDKGRYIPGKSHPMYQWWYENISK